MKPGQVFWGVFLLALGALLLLDNLNLFLLDWGFVPKLWPLILVFWGLAALVTAKQVKWLFTGLVALLLALLVYWFFSFRWIHHDHGPLVSGETTTQTLVEPFKPGTEHASLNVKTGAAGLALEGTTSQLIEAQTRTSFGKYELEREEDDAGTHLDLRFADGSFRWRLGRMKNSAEIRLHADPSWDLEFNVGAVSAELDASELKTERVRIDGGASTIRLRLGDRADRCDVDIRSGVSSVRVDVPASVGCEISVKAPLSSKSFLDFEETGDGVYQTDNFDSAAKKIFINFDVGVSTLRVRRY